MNSSDGLELQPVLMYHAIHVVMEAGGSMLVDKIVSDSQELPVINTGVITAGWSHWNQGTCMCITAQFTTSGEMYVMCVSLGSHEPAIFSSSTRNMAVCKMRV